MGDTIFYRGKIKRTKSPAEVFAKIQKSIKKKGPTKNWTCTVDVENECLCIDFHDDASESFVLAFNGTEFDGFCKVAFPLEGELFEDGKSEFKALLDALYAAKSMYSKIEIFDDYGLAESYWDSKRFKCAFRELTAQEKERVRRLYDAGCTDYKQLLLAVVAEDMGIAVDELEKNISPLVQAADAFDTVRSTGERVRIWSSITGIMETYIYETTEFQKRGRVCELPYAEYSDLGALGFASFAFAEGMNELYSDYNSYRLDHGDRSFGVKHAQVRLMFREKFYPALQAENDSFEKCILAYRFFVSAFEHAGFRYVGRMDAPRTPFEAVIQRYGEVKAKIFLTYYCTLREMGFRVKDKDEIRKRSEIFVQNIISSYDKEFLEEYLAFSGEYGKDAKFAEQVRYAIKYMPNYVKLLLVGM